MLKIFLLLYIFYIPITIAFFFIFYPFFRNVSQETFDEIEEKPWRIDTLLKIFGFIFCHGIFIYLIGDRLCTKIDYWFNTNKKFIRLKKKVKDNLNKKIF